MNAERWEKLSFSAQMGNIGSEINRAIYWDKKGSKEEKINSLWRTLELLDSTIQQRKKRELFRLREVICDLFLGKKEYNIPEESLKEYFVQFAMNESK